MVWPGDQRSDFRLWGGSPRVSLATRRLNSRTLFPLALDLRTFLEDLD